MSVTTNWQTAASEILSELDLDHFGFAELKTPKTFSYYQNWIDKKYHADMKYLEVHTPQKKDPTQYLAHAKSVLVVTQPYEPHPMPQNLPLKSTHLKTRAIAKYAQGVDYHFFFKEKLQQLALKLKKRFPHEEFLCCTDSSPVLERDFARTAHIGWVGKNTCIIHPDRGSLFFLGEILTTAPLNDTKFSNTSILNADPFPDRCGTCTRCIEACPTQAIEEPYLLNSNKCISYWTIEAKTVPSKDLQNKMGMYYFGCDICQLVCPWNQKAFGKNLFSSTHFDIEYDRANLLQDLKTIITSSHKQIEKIFYATPLMRTPPLMHKRNALMMIAHYNLHELKEDVISLQTQTRLSPSQDNKLGELIESVLNKLSG